MLKEKVLNELRNKIKSITIEDAKKIAIYTAIATYVCEEEISEEYKDFLLEKDNTIDYLYQAYLDNRHNYYIDIKEALDFDQKTF